MQGDDDRAPVPDAATGATPAEPGPRLVLFDFDGVLMRGDAFSSLVRRRLDRAPWRKLAGMALSLPLLPTLPFSRHWVSMAFVSAALLGLSEEAYRDLARAHAERLVRQPRRFHRQALTGLRQHLAGGDRVIVVTGCEEHLVRGIFRELGLDGLTILATRLKPGRLGLRVDWHNIGRRKVDRLAAEGVAPPWAMAYSDSPLDVPMLREAEQAVLVNATPKGCKKVERALGRSVTRVQWY